MVSTWETVGFWGNRGELDIVVSPDSASEKWTPFTEKG